MNRRAFLAVVLGAAVVDPERALWVPGRKVISIPPPHLTAGQLINDAWRQLNLEFLPPLPYIQLEEPIRHLNKMIDRWNAEQFTLPPWGLKP